MKRILISLPDELLEVAEKNAKGKLMTRSEYIRDLIRKDSKPEITLSQTAEVPRDVPVTVVIPSQNDQEGAREGKVEEKVEKVRKALSTGKGKPMFCPKHKASRIGDRYTCGCEV